RAVAVSISPGTIIKRELFGWWGWCFWHMGVYVGNGMVVHFNGEIKKAKYARLILEPLESFARNQKWRVHVRPRNAAHGEAVCREALRLLELGSRSGFDGKYDLFWRNCEDFCVRCYQVAYA